MIMESEKFVDFTIEFANKLRAKDYVGAIAYAESIKPETLTESQHKWITESIAIIRKKHNL